MRPTLRHKLAQLDARRRKVDMEVELGEPLTLAAFVQQAWHVLEPSTSLRWGCALNAICQHLEAVTAGQLNRLLINCPPGMAKSLLCSVFWPAWSWGPAGRAHERFLSFSYSDRLSIRDNRRTRLLVQSAWFQA